MNQLLKKAGLGVALAATAITASAPAEAQRYDRYRHHRGGDATGAAIVGGIAGLAIGAAIASSGRDRYRERYYDNGYYNQPYYNNSYQQEYYRPQYRPNYNYYRPYREERRCWVERRYDPNYGGPVRVRICR